MDAFSSIYDSRGGDVSALSSLIVLLSTANAIGQDWSSFIAKTEKSGRQLLFAFFHGESLGYIGSSRWIWDMDRGQFPHSSQTIHEKSLKIQQIKTDGLSFYMEVSQIDNNRQLFLHSDKNVYKRNRTLV